MRTILDQCVEMDRFAEATYRAMAAATKDPELEAVFSRMAVEEANHLAWWSDLATAWDNGLVPDVVADSQGLEQHMANLFTELHALTPADFSDVSDDTKLELAVHMEFFMIDPIFGELLDLTEPGGARKHREAYARHLERIIGAVETFYSRGELASFLARVLRRAWRDNLALAAFATRDPLTTLYNRRGLMAHLDQWMSWAMRYGRPFGILLADVDDFKHINDTYGHSVGDMALRSIAQALSDTVRGSDMVARYGGDEFAIIAPEASLEDLAQLAERLVDAVSKKSIPDWDGSPVYLHISIGGAVAAAAATDGSGLDAILATADRSLYHAKAAGKGRAGEILTYQPEEIAAAE